MCGILLTERVKDPAAAVRASVVYKQKLIAKSPVTALRSAVHEIIQYLFSCPVKLFQRLLFIKDGNDHTDTLHHNPSKPAAEAVSVCNAAGL